MYLASVPSINVQYHQAYICPQLEDQIYFQLEAQYQWTYDHSRMVKIS